MNRVCGVRVTHRATGISARILTPYTRPPPHRITLTLAVRLLRARLWQHRHRCGPQAIVRTYDLLADAEASLAILEGNLPEHAPE